MSAAGGIEQVLRQLEEQQRRIGEVQKNLASVQVTGHSADRLVSVTLDHAMKVAGITIDSQAMRMTSFRLAESLQDALSAAYAEWEQYVAELTGEIVGDETLVRDATSGSITPQDWFRRFGVDLDAIYGDPRRGA